MRTPISAPSLKYKNQLMINTLSYPLFARSLEIYQSKSVMFIIRRFNFNWFHSAIYAYD